MKDFLKQVAAVIVGTMIVSFFSTILSVIMFVAIMAINETKVPLEEGSVLHLRLSGVIEEQSPNDPMAEFMGIADMDYQGLDQILSAIRVAKTDDRVKGIYIEGGAVSTDIASLQEIRKALVDFKKSKKFVLAYGDQYSQGAYYVASVADQLWVNPSGMIDWHGLSSQPMFYKDLLEKVGVKMQVFRVGKFKSAVEPFTETEMSPANREQVTAFLQDIWQNMLTDVATSRKLTTQQLAEYANGYVMLSDPRAYVKTKLADKLVYIDQVRDELRKKSGEDEVTLISPADLAMYEELDTSDNRIAVYYAYGDIVDVAGTNSMGDSHEIVGDQIVKDLDELAQDDDVKAVVLRINSGGGSAYASEQMWRAVQMLKKKKPVVVSMGGLAASGGYYMSCGADRIVAEPTTLTGSIGIFGLVPDPTALLTDKLGLHFDVVKTSESADFGAMGRPLSPSEAGAMQAYVERGYSLFLSRVAEGRKLTVADVDSIAQGRVWTGKQALKLKLVDQLGTLEDAIAEAAKLSKTKEYGVDCYPAPLTWLEQLQQTSVGGHYLEGRLRTALGTYYAPLHFINQIGNRPSLQARIMFDPNLN